MYVLRVLVWALCEESGRLEEQTWTFRCCTMDSVTRNLEWVRDCFLGPDERIIDWHTSRQA